MPVGPETVYKRIAFEMTTYEWLAFERELCKWL